MLRSILIHSAQWFVITRQGAQPAPPPEYVATSIIAKPEWPGMPPIRGIVEAPVFAADGTLSTEPGYQPNTRLWFQPKPGFVTVPVSDQPSPAEVAAARRVLLDELLVDFPFHDAASRAHIVALLLLPFVRELINGPTPQHLVDAPTPGTGKGLLSDIAALIATGREAGKTPAPKTDEEWRKRITSQLMHGSNLIITDNLAEKLDSASLAAALTTTEWEDRKLGVNMLIQVPNRATWVATGNNVTLSNELARRTAWIRLTPNVEEPWKRTEFKHPDLKPWVREHRGRLVHALLTLARAWLAAGRPRSGGVRLGSFEDWCDVVGGIVTAAGIPGFLANHGELYDAADTEMAPWRALVEVWADKLTSGFVRVDELMILINQYGLLAEELGDERLSERARKTKLGILLRKYRDRVIAGYRIQAAADNGRREYSMYRLEKAQ
jgi:putative DNA primase/helicase